jgi:DNA-binding NarL/FixJ family response regulator
MISVVVIDDELLIQRGLTLTLEADPDMRVVGCGSGADAVELIERTRPDVVLLDIHMPDVDGLTVLREVKARGGRMPIAILTTFGSEEHVQEALRLGAAGFLLKDTAPDHLPNHVRTIATGGVVLAPAVSRSLSAPYSDASVRRTIGDLTPRETAVLAEIGDGLTNAEIAKRLHLSVGTVKDHVSAVLGKLGVASRVHAALVAERGGLLRDRGGRW